jgi:saccharopine dehydrogenase-like protein
VVVLGAYGVFGSRVVRSLVKHGELEVVVAGRNGRAADVLCASLPGRNATPITLDCDAPDAVERLQALRPSVVVDTVGPFQARSLALARACAEGRIHYIDLADSRLHVCSIAELDPIARETATLIVSGASTVPALTTAVVDELIRDLVTLDAIDVGISPGHRGPRGVATVESILSYCGRRIPAFRNAMSTTEFGWGGLHRHGYPAPVGSRWLSNVDVPERNLWPSRYRALRSIRLAAGLELSVLHLALSAAARLVRLGAIRSLVPRARFMIHIADAFDSWASDAGAMHVRIDGVDQRRHRVRRTWTLVAEHGDGPQIPATPAAVLVKKLLGVPGYAPLTERGARPCVELLTLGEILAELAPFAIQVHLDEQELAPQDSSHQS